LLAAFASGGKASVISPLTGMYPLVSIPVAMVVLGERIGGREIAGVMLALAAVAGLSWESKPAVLSSEVSNLKSPG
jgi:drug/metabolite transporter (DMT)-like permease